MTTIKDQEFAGAMTGTNTFASPIGLDRIIRKEVSLGAIREMPVPQGHIGLGIAPFLSVDSDDVIFDYIKDATSTGLTPARAEDAESELAQKDEMFVGQGRASIIDWAEKNRYSPSDVTRYNDALIMQAAMSGASVLTTLDPAGSTVRAFQSRVARDDALRSKKIYNRIEWLIQQALWHNQITYNDGKIKFNVEFGRPASQYKMAPTGALWSAGTSHDPIGDLMVLNEYMYDTYGVTLNRAITSQKVLNTIWKSDRFISLTGLVGNAASAPIDPMYLMPGWSNQAAIQIVENATGIKFEVYDSVYRTRPIGSTVITNNRFSPQTDILFLPNLAELSEIDATEVGFGKTLTSIHPEGNFTAGFYEWEDTTKDPWMHVRGSGIKAFPVFPYLEYTATMTVIS